MISKLFALALVVLSSTQSFAADNGCKAMLQSASAAGVITRAEVNLTVRTIGESAIYSGEWNGLKINAVSSPKYSTVSMNRTGTTDQFTARSAQGSTAVDLTFHQEASHSVDTLVVKCK